MGWPISDEKKQKLLDKLYDKWTEILRQEAQHISVMVAGPAKYNSRKLDHSDQILRLSSEFVEWFKDLEAQKQAADALSAFGIAAPGRELDVLERGLTEFDGPFPVNASGGLIGCGHPVGASGVRMFLDLYKQVAEKAGTYQLAKARTGMMLNIGGSATTNFVYIVGRGEG